MPSFLTEKLYKNLMALSANGLAYRSIASSLKDSAGEEKIWINLLESKDPWVINN
jgi:hypothetical protein